MKKKLLPILISLFIVSCKHQTTDTCFSENNNTYIPANIETIHPTGKLIIDSLIGIRKIHMDVFPDFQHKRFEISFKTILIMRPIHFIIIYKHIKKTTRYIKYKLSNIK